MRRFVLIGLLALFGCNSDNPASSTRSLERMVVGTWFVEKPEITGGLLDNRHIIFKPDGTFSAPWGMAGPLLLEYKGQYWAQGHFVGAHGVGGFEGEGRLHIQFAQIQLTYSENYDALGLVVTEILPDHIAALGKHPDEMNPGDVQQVLDQLNNTPPPESAKGAIRTFIKVQLAPGF